jgi:hypothetical protein
MSSSPASCYTCSLKASCAFATSASSPTGGGPLSCHFAGKPSQWFSRKPNQKHPRPSKPDRFGSAQVWRTHGGHRETHGCPAPAPLATLSRRSRRMKLQFQPPPLGAPHRLQAGCALLALQQPICSQPRITIPLLPHANYNQTSPAFTLSNSSSCSRCLSHNPQDH